MSLLLRILQMLGTLTSRFSTIAVAIDGLATAQKAFSAKQAETQAAVQVLNEKLDQIIGLLTVGDAVSATFTVTIDGQTTEGVTMLQLTTTEEAALGIQFFDKNKQPTGVDGPPVWTSSNDAVATVVPGTLAADGTVTPDPTGINAVVIAHTVGTAQITNTADADMSPGVRNLINTLDVTVSPAEAVSGNITTAIPVEQP